MLSFSLSKWRENLAVYNLHISEEKGGACFPSECLQVRPEMTNKIADANNVSDERDEINTFEIKSLESAKWILQFLHT